MNYTIRPACEGDIAAIYEIEQSCFTMPHTISQLTSCLDSSRHIFPAAVSDTGEVLGYVEMSYIIDEGYISNVAVKDACRGCGIASAIMDYLISEAEKLSLSFITLEVRESNAPAIGLYLKKGFEKVAVQNNCYSQPKENAVIMTRFLKSEV